MFEKEDQWTTGGYDDPIDELKARREVMASGGYSPCNMPACNCGKWHKSSHSREARMEMLLDELYDTVLDENVTGLAARKLKTEVEKILGKR